VIFQHSLLLDLSVIFFITTAVLLLTALLISYRREKFRNKKLSIDDLISSTITAFLLSEADEIDMEMVAPGIHLLSNSSFNRKMMAKALVTAKKNLSGKAGESVVKLYERLGLHTDAAKKVKSRRWHVRAAAIQELSIMNQHAYWKPIYKLTAHSNEYVRMEAQAGIVRLLGFPGLRFLNTAAHHLTEWQQINLLHLLKDIPVRDFQGIDRWLFSANPTVAIFALKLAARFRRYELLEAVAACREHADASVRAQTIKCLQSLDFEEEATTNVIAV